MSHRTWALAAACAGACLAFIPSAHAQKLHASTQLHSYTQRNAGQQVVSDYIVAVVNNEPITHQELRARLIRIELQLQHAGQPLPDRAELEKQLLQKMIDDRAQVQEAKDMGLRVDDASVQQALQNMAAQNNLTDTQLLEKLRNDGVSITQLRHDLRDELLLDKVHEYQVSRAKVDEGELDTFIAQQKGLSGEAQQSSEYINLAQLLVAVPEKATPDQVAALRKKADDLAARAQHEDFATLVKYSDAQRANAGAMGLRPSSEYPDIFVNASHALKVGQVSSPVRSEAGFHILKLLERKRPSNDTVVETLVRHIVIKPDAQHSEAQTIALLRQLKQDIASGKISFEEAASKYSQDGSALRGGSLGWTEPGQFVPEFEAVMNTLTPGQISDPIVSRFGVHLIQVQDRRRVQVDEAQQRELARRALQQKKGEDAYRQWAEDVRARAFIEMRPAPDGAAP